MHAHGKPVDTTIAVWLGCSCSYSPAADQGLLSQTEVTTGVEITANTCSYLRLVAIHIIT